MRDEYSLQYNFFLYERKALFIGLENKIKIEIFFLYYL